jgi:hypothetical protein
VTATARKLAILFYRALRFGLTYADPGVSAYDARYRHRVIHNLHRRAKSLGYSPDFNPIEMAFAIYRVHRSSVCLSRRSRGRSRFAGTCRSDRSCAWEDTSLDDGWPHPSIHHELVRR